MDRTNPLDKPLEEPLENLAEHAEDRIEDSLKSFNPEDLTIIYEFLLEHHTASVRMAPAIWVGVRSEKHLKSMIRKRLDELASSDVSRE